MKPTPIDISTHAVKYPTYPETHPLDPLTYAELQNVVRIIRESGHFDSDMRFVSIATHDPPRDLVRAYAPGAPYERLADVVISDGRRAVTVEALVSLSRACVVSFEPTRHKGQAAITPDEFVEVEIAAKMNYLVADALRKRGLDISDRNLVCVDPWSAGYFGDDEDPKRRVARATFYLRKEADDMQYAHPIEGLNALVDLVKKEVIKIEDAGPIAVPDTQRNYDRRFIKKFRDDLKPIEIKQPEGPSFTVKGWEVSWQRWRFRIGFTPREGLVLNDVRYNDVDKGLERSIIYRAAIAEMTVPYGDPIQTQWRKNAFDIGEYGVGVNTNSLTLGCDCLGEIHYFDYDFVNTAGEIESIPNAICMHEEDDSILWKHTELRTNKVEVRRSRKLVISFIATVGNYEYGFYWHLRQDGSIEVEIKAIGLMQTAATLPGQTTKYGTFVEERCYAPIHQHFFCARLDMSIDGPQNQVVEVETKADPMGPDNPHGSAFYAHSTVFKTELEARRRHHYESVRTWVVQNPNVKNRMGGNVGYKIQPMELAVPYWQPQSAIAKRAGYLDYHLWVTPFNPEEKFPAGQYPNQNPGPDGLPVWTQKDRNIQNTEIVVWYNFGHHHVPRLEDWPLMPVAKLGFMLKPANFFDIAACMDVPPSLAKQGCSMADERGFSTNKISRLNKTQIRRKRLEEEAQKQLEARKAAAPPRGRTK
ncbi:MAG: primary-amine oxidase [Pseudomonadota bacterium]|nr:primary-amine oxidase [Pseudomonadota bacterium]